MSDDDSRPRPTTHRVTADVVAIGAPRRVAYLITLVILPFVVLAAAVPVFWGWGMTWLDVGLGLVMYGVGILGITAGYHRHFTHRSFKARRGLRIALAIAGGLAMEGPVKLWVAEHRRHHKYADKQGDPHSPWLFGTGRTALLKGLWHAQIGWFHSARTTSSYDRYVPDLLKDPDVRRLDRWYPLTIAVSLLLPPLVAGWWTQSWQGMVSAFFWASLVRYAVVHHATWSVNSMAHAFGDQPYRTPDQSRDNRWVALLTFGEGWHNFHHAAPTSARHGALKGQFDLTAVVIRLFERLGWAYDVRWPDPATVAAKRR